MTAETENTRLPLLKAERISKAFGQNPVLRDVNFTLFEGEVLALVGENGAGKSTLMNIISGGLRHDGGRFVLATGEYAPSSPVEALDSGVAIAHQETAIMPDLTVAENVFFGREPLNALGFVRQSALHKRCAKLLLELDFPIDPHTMGGDLNAAERQMVEIARAVSLDPRILVLDEPTASLSSKAAGRIVGLMKQLSERGTAIIFISHRLGEIMEAADRVIVLKDGELTLEAERDAFDRDDLVHAMVGRKLTNVFPPRPEIPPDAPIRFALKEAANSDLPAMSLEVRRGEVLGVAGLEGQGQKELAQALCGARPFRSGTIELDGNPVRITSVARAIALGVATIPDDRKRDGLALGLPVRTNMSLFALEQSSRAGFLPLAEENRFVRAARERFSVKAASLEQPVGQLSGGNQQKVVFARWLSHTPNLLVLSEPTKGVDIQTKSEIYRLIAELSAKGVAIILISSDLLELIGVSDRILTLYERRISGEIHRDDFSEETIMRHATDRAQADAPDARASAHA